jgi:hypothetical protein
MFVVFDLSFPVCAELTKHYAMKAFEVNGQLHVPAAFPPEPPEPIG